MDITGEQTPKKFVMSEALIRQRRNLIVTAVIAIMLRYGGVEISKVGALGTELTIANKSALYVALWLTLSYFILRYYQYLMYEMKGNLANIYEMHRNAAAQYIIKFAAGQAHKKDLQALNKYRKEKGYELHSLDFNVKPFSFSSSEIREGRLIVHVRIEQSNTEWNNHEISVSKWWLLPIHATAVLGIIFTRPIFTDLAFPFVLAAIAIVYGWDGDWTGSILNTTYVLLN